MALRDSPGLSANLRSRQEAGGDDEGTTCTVASCPLWALWESHFPDLSAPPSSAIGSESAVAFSWRRTWECTMSAEAVGAQMPAQITLDDLAVMSAADENHRYELSPEGVLSVEPPADPDHALLVSRMFAWFLTNGYGPEQVVTDCGIDVGGGRVPDLTVWAEGRPPRPARSSYAGTDGLLLAVEVVSKGSELIDRVIKEGRVRQGRHSPILGDRARQHHLRAPAHSRS